MTQAELPAVPEQPLPDRLSSLVTDNFQFVWRVLRRIGSKEWADDATQQTFVVAANKVDQIQPGCERAYLFHTAIRVAAHMRRSCARRREVPEEEASDVHDPHPCPDDLTDRMSRRKMLDEILDAMPDDQRSVFVLFELEGISMHEIAPMLGLPVGTVASRLRRARDTFHTEAKRLRARLEFQGGAR